MIKLDKYVYIVVACTEFYGTSIEAVFTKENDAKEYMEECYKYNNKKDYVIEPRRLRND